MDNGWVKLHRNILEWEWYDDANTTRLFIHCLLRANHSDNMWRGILVKRGQFISSYDGLSRELNLSVKKIRTGLKKLKSTGEVASHSTSQHTVFIINNYDHYQERASEEDNEGQTEGKQRASNKNEKNEKKSNTSDLSAVDSKYKFSEDDTKLAQWIYGLILKTAPKTKEPNFDKWANTIRLMRESDKLSHREIAEVFKWANQDMFWCMNVLSPDKLRKQFAKLHALSTANQSQQETEAFL